MDRLGARAAGLLLLTLVGSSGGQGVWDLTATVRATSADCLKNNSPPCACDRDAEAVPFFARALPSELPSPLGSAPHPAAALDFPIARYRDPASSRRPCAQFAIEVSGAAGGLLALNATARRIGDASASVDVFAHLYSVRDAEAELATLKQAFGPMLREVVFERWGAPIEEHIASYANNSSSVSAPKPLDWLVGELTRRYSRRICGEARAENSPEMRCRRPWRTVLLHVLSMWRKIFLASTLRRQHERVRSCKYAAVVRTRSDAKPTRPLDLRRFVEPLRTTPNMAHALCAGMGRRYCKQRARVWPQTACWADDQFALGAPDAMHAYAQLFLDFPRFVWWYPFVRADGWRHVSERLLGVHFDWRRRAAAAPTAGPREPFDWHVRQPDGRIDFGWELECQLCYRCMSDRPVPKATSRRQ